MTSDELAEALRALKLGQSELSRILGVSRNTVSRWALGERPTPAYLGWALEGIAHHRGQCLHLHDLEPPAGAGRPRRRRYQRSKKTDAQA